MTVPVYLKKISIHFLLWALLSVASHTSLSSVPSGMKKPDYLIFLSAASLLDRIPVNQCKSRKQNQAVILKPWTVKTVKSALRYKFVVT